MTPLLLALHLALNAPGPARLSLETPPLTLRWLGSAPAAALEARSPEPWVPRVDWGARALEVGTAVGFLVGGQAVVLGLNVLAFSAVSGLGPVGALGVLLVLALDVIDVLAFPLLPAWGAQVAAGALGLTGTNTGFAALGAYLGAAVTVAAVVGALFLEVLSLSPVGSAPTYTLVAGALALPVLCGVGASVGLHWASPLEAAPAAPPPPPPSLRPEPDPRLAPPPPAALGIRLEVLRFG